MTNQVSVITAVFFDFDGTIRHSEPRGADVFQHFAAQSGAVFTEQQRLEGERWLHYYWAQSNELMEDIKTFGDSENEEFWWQHARRHLQILGIHGEKLELISRKITQQMSEDYQPEDHIPDEVYSTLRMLKEQGYFLGVVSNRHGGLEELVDELQLSEYLDMVIAAGEVGSWKPDPGLLQHALEMAQVSSNESVYVGDNYYADVVAAQAAGIHPVLIDPKDLYPGSEIPRIQSMDELPAVLASIG